MPREMCDLAPVRARMQIRCHARGMAGESDQHPNPAPPGKRRNTAASAPASAPCTASHSTDHSMGWEGDGWRRVRIRTLWIRGVHVIGGGSRVQRVHRAEESQKTAGESSFCCAHEHPADACIAQAMGEEGVSPRSGPRVKMRPTFGGKGGETHSHVLGHLAVHGDPAHWASRPPSVERTSYGTWRLITSFEN